MKACRPQTLAPPAGAPPADKLPGLLRALGRDERGAVIMEFVLVMYVFFILFFGVLQIGHMCLAAHYLNYANMMASRTAAALLDQQEEGLLSAEEFERRVVSQAAMALGPLEARMWRNPGDPAALDDVRQRLRFIWRYGDDEVSRKQLRPLQTRLRGRLEYRMPLIFPFVNRVIAATQQSAADSGGGRRAASVDGYPSALLSSNFDISAAAGSEAPPHDHPMEISRRWHY